MIPALITITITFAATVILTAYIGVKAIRQTYRDGCEDTLNDLKRDAYWASFVEAAEQGDRIEFMSLH